MNEKSCMLSLMHGENVECLGESCSLWTKGTEIHMCLIRQYFQVRNHVLLAELESYKEGDDKDTMPIEKEGNDVGVA